MEQRIIGTFKVSVLGIGTSRLASLGAHGSVRTVARLLDTAADLGISFIDTADAYGSTACERWLGKVLRKRSHHFVIATKCGQPTVDLPRPLRALNQPAKKVIQRAGKQHYLDPVHIKRSIDSSLIRLNRERIEIYFVHQPPRGVEQMDEVFSTLDDARAAGKIGVYGVCSGDADIVQAALLANRCTVVQTAVNPLVTHRILAALRTATPRDSAEVIANNVLSDCMRRRPAVPEVSATAAVAVSRRLDALSAERGVSKAHLLIRHAAAVSNVRAVLTGTSNPAHLADNAAALSQPVTPEDLLTLDACASPG